MYELRHYPGFPYMRRTPINYAAKSSPPIFTIFTFSLHSFPYLFSQKTTFWLSVILVGEVPKIPRRFHSIFPGLQFFLWRIPLLLPALYLKSYWLLISHNQFDHRFEDDLIATSENQRLRSVKVDRDRGLLVLFYLERCGHLQLATG
jgi:hypothetical protein